MCIPRSIPQAAFVVRWLEDSSKPGGQLYSEFGNVVNLQGVDSGHLYFFDTVMQSLVCQL